MMDAAHANQEVSSGTKPGYYTVNCFISWIFVPEDLKDRQLFYLACITCKKRVSDCRTGYRCERCNKTYGDAVPTYNFSAKVSDLSCTISLQCLGETGEAFMGLPCTEFFEIAEDIE